MSASATYAIGTVGVEAARPKSPTMRIGRRGRRSTQTPAGSVKRMNGRKSTVPRTATSKALASSTRIATSGKARSSICEPNRLIVSADHSFRKSPCRQRPPLGQRLRMVHRPRKRCRRMEQRIGETVPLPLRRLRGWMSATRRFSRFSKRRRASGVSRTWMSAEASSSRPRDELVGSLSQHRRREHATLARPAPTRRLS